MIRQSTVYRDVIVKYCSVLTSPYQAITEPRTTNEKTFDQKIFINFFLHNMLKCLP